MALVPRPIPQCAIDLLAAFEGYRDVAYQDQGGVWTVGFGHTAGVVAGQTCTLGQAKIWLLSDAAGAALAVQNGVTLPLNDNQFGALISFTFNEGRTAFLESTLRRLINANTFTTDTIKLQLLRWCDVRGKFDAGLYRRRIAEAALFITPIPVDASPGLVP